MWDTRYFLLHSWHHKPEPGSEECWWSIWFLAWSCLDHNHLIQKNSFIESLDINALMKWSPFIQKQIGAWPRVHIGPEDWAVVWCAIFHGLSEEMIGKLISASGYEEAGCDSANADTRGQECWWWPGALLPINCCHWPLPCPAQQPTLLT